MTEAKKTVLLIEDDQALNRAAKFKLEQKGHTVISTTNAEEALKILKEKKDEIDVIWLDLLLPGMNGVEFLAEVRKDPGLKNERAVICSVSGRGDERRIVQEMGAVDYLVKSDYDIDGLVNKVVGYAE